MTRKQGDDRRRAVLYPVMIVILKHAVHENVEFLAMARSKVRWISTVVLGDKTSSGKSPFVFLHVCGVDALIL